MDLQQPDRKPAPESALPMINIVFLLLIFFLISATLAPPSDVTPPISRVEGASAAPALLILERDGGYRFGAITGAPALQAAVDAFKQGEADAPFTLLADAQAQGPALAKATRALASLGIRQVALTTVFSPVGDLCGAGETRPC